MMKIFITTIIVISSLSSYASDIKENGKRKFAEEYRSYFELRKEFPDNLDVYVMFLDLDGDGNQEALATSYGKKYQDGWHWSAFIQNNNGKWKLFKRPKKITDKTVVYARPDAFYRFKAEGKPSHVIILNKVYAKVYAKGLEPDVTALRITINKKGILNLKKFRLQTNKISRNTNTLNMKPSKSD